MKFHKVFGAFALAAVTAAMCVGFAACDKGGPTDDDTTNEDLENLTTYTFEAEHTDLSNWYGAGFSSNPAGTMAITADKWNANASNGYFICDMYANGSTIAFDIEASADVDNVTLVLRATAEKGIASLTDEQFMVGYYPDGESSTIIEYGKLEFDGVKSDWKESGLRPFSDFTISKTVSLKQGINHIVFAVMNDDAIGGTAKASGCLIDCIKLGVAEDSGVTLSMEKNEQSLKQIERLEDV